MSDIEDKTVHGNVGAIIETNHGQVRVSQHSVSDLQRFRSMSLEELHARRELLRKKHQAARRAFFRHPTLLGFGLVIAVPVVFFLGTWGERPTIATTLSFLVCMFIVFAVSVWMASRRRPLFDGLVLLKDELKLVEAFIAIHEAEVIYDR